MTGPLFRVRRLRKEFAGHAVLRDADVEIRRGEVLGLVGRGDENHTAGIRMDGPR